MSKKLLWFIASFMVFGMAGLILVQTYWINNALKIKENQFNQTVNQCLTNIAIEIERREAMLHILREVQPQRNEGIFLGGSDMDAAPGSEAENTSVNDFNLSYTMEYYSSGIPQWYSSNVRNDSNSIQLPESKNYEDSMSNFTVPGAYSSNNRPGSYNNPGNRIQSKKGLVEKLVSDLYNQTTKFADRVDKNSVERIIKHHFGQQDLDLSFEYAIFDPDHNVVHKSKDYKPSKDDVLYPARLFPLDLFSKSGYLNIYFPRQKTYIFRSIGMMGASSLILTTIIIAIFVVTIYALFRQKRLSEMKNDFVNNMTHELKTPISTISLASQMLNDSTIPVANKNISHISKIIDTESKRLGFQVEKVLQMAIFDKGKIILKEKKLNLHELILSVINNFDIQVKKKGGKITWNFEAPNSMVNVDEVHMANVISNLLDNAVKYCKEIPEIKVSTKNKKSFIVLSVEDNGIGISKENQKRIFEQFYRVPTGNIHKVKGFGLGLSYVRKLVEIHHGFVNLTSEVGKGSRFDISLPVAS